MRACALKKLVYLTSAGFLIYICCGAMNERTSSSYEWLKNLTKKGLQFWPKKTNSFFDYVNHLFFILLSGMTAQKSALFANFVTFEMVSMLTSKTNCNKKKKKFKGMLVAIKSNYVCLVYVQGQFCRTSTLFVRLWSLSRKEVLLLSPVTHSFQYLLI